LKFLKLYREQINNASAKLAFHMSKSGYNLMKHLHNCSGIFLEEKLITRPAGIETFKNDFLYQTAEDVLQHTISAGIPQHMVKYHDGITLKIEPEINDDEGPKVLALKDLAFGFNIWLIVVGISLLVFILEWVYFHLKITIKREVKRFLGNLFVLINVSLWMKRNRI
jgi:hypothetical protein